METFNYNCNDAAKRIYELRRKVILLKDGESVDGLSPIKITSQEKAVKPAAKIKVQEIS